MSNKLLPCIQCGCYFDIRLTSMIEQNGDLYCNDCYANTFIECFNCNKIIRIGDSKEYGCNSYCDECYDELFIKCYQCEEIINKDDAKFNDCDAYCEDCFYEDFEICYHCDTVIYKDNVMLGPNDNMYCEDCWNDRFVKCNECSEIISIDNSYTGCDDERYCERCFDELFGECMNCGEIFYRGDLTYSNDEYHCRSCYEENQSNIRDYGYKPFPILYNTNNNNNNNNNNYLYLGVELEVEYDGIDIDDCISELLGFSNDERLFYLKQDGSLHHGFELVTHPMTIEYHKNEFNWNEILEWLKNNNFKSHNTDTCGLHIHATKKFLNEREQRRLSAFVSFNQSQIEVIARRGVNNFCNYKKMYKKKNTIEGIDYYDKKIKFKDANKNWYGRNESVNWYNDSTYEFRIFKGSLVYNTIISSLEFVDSLSRFIKTINIRNIIDNSSWIKYIDYLHSNNGDYGELIEYMKERQGKKSCGIELIKPENVVVDVFQ